MLKQLAGCVESDKVIRTIKTVILEVTFKEKLTPKEVMMQIPCWNNLTVYRHQTKVICLMVLWCNVIWCITPYKKLYGVMFMKF